jgi:hypothetical protein
MAIFSEGTMFSRGGPNLSILSDTNATVIQTSGVTAGKQPKEATTDWKTTAGKVAMWILQSLGVIGEFVTTPLRSISSRFIDQTHTVSYAEEINNLQLKQLEKELTSFFKQKTGELDEPVLDKNKKLNRIGLTKALAKKDLKSNEIEDFINKLNELLLKINIGAKQSIEIGMEKCSSAEEIFRDLEALLQTKVYQAHRTNDISVVRLLQQLSYASFYTNATAATSLWGEKILQEEPLANQTLSDFSTVLPNANNKAYHTHGALWALVHPKNSIHAGESKLLTSYNAHQNNPSFVVTTPQRSLFKKELPLQKYGPTPTDYHRWTACLDHLSKKNQCEIMVCLKDTKGPEGKHQEILYSEMQGHRINNGQEGHPKALYFASIPYNMRSEDEIKKLIAHASGNFEQNFMSILCQDHLSDEEVTSEMDIRNVQVSESKVRSQTLDKKSNRFVIPKDFLPDEELKECYTLTANFFAHDPISNKSTPEQKLQRALDMQRFLLNVILTRFENNCIKHANGKIASVSSPCKQDFDRGGITKILRSVFNAVIDANPTEGDETEFTDQEIQHIIQKFSRVHAYDGRVMDQGKLNDGVSLLNVIAKIERNLINTGKTLQQEFKNIFSDQNTSPQRTQPIPIPKRNLQQKRGPNNS